MEKFSIPRTYWHLRWKQVHWRIFSFQYYYILFRMQIVITENSWIWQWYTMSYLHLRCQYQGLVYCIFGWMSSFSSAILHDPFSAWHLVRSCFYGLCWNVFEGHRIASTSGYLKSYEMIYMEVLVQSILALVWNKYIFCVIWLINFTLIKVNFFGSFFVFIWFLYMCTSILLSYIP